ncbi:hypothetical protein SERLADRAFT_438366 [Serpula lacrymans var. lacrymans S7.9]|uniref:Integrase catalytic domain-containing protein n=1 Tax=Serpula lacrymans var. lacrymans (strain S7.9) TaxID=578457 RepID=F8NXT9_SERL9|nr:uncharacterized protein SERLADRAFT_438366 [Serpula lacrymans var. lacrymans S7.9]EGO24755.1 hypothetical protein SERLADRAFT_438366 [Serpula lacrymans var. lacrymans S7.9]
MTDGGSHFGCAEVSEWFEKEKIEIIHTPVRSPWVNGLIEDANKILIGQLKRLCATGYKEDEKDFEQMNTPSKWPLHLSTAIAQMNNQVLPWLGFSQRELLMGITLTGAEKPKTTEEGIVETTPETAETHMAFVDRF